MDNSPFVTAIKFSTFDAVSEISSRCRHNQNEMRSSSPDSDTFRQMQLYRKLFQFATGDF